MTAVSLSAQPIPPEVAEAAAGLSGRLREPLQLLRASRLDSHRCEHRPAEYRELSRSHSRGSRHRARRRPAAGLAHAAGDAWERRVSRARRRSSRTIERPVTDVKTTQYAQVAAERATTALAFDRAAEFFELLATLEQDAERKREWLEKRGEALVNAGEGRKAADAFRAALEFAADEDVAIRLQTRQAAELIRAAYVEDAMVVLRSLLPRKSASACPKPTHRHSNAEACTTRCSARSAHECRSGSCAPAAARSCCAGRRAGGDQRAVVFRVARAGKRAERAGRLARGPAGRAQASRHGADRVVRPRVGSRNAFMNRALELIAEAHVLSDRLGDPWMKGRTQLASGIFYKMNGRWKEGVERLDTSIATFATCRGVRWEIETANTLRYDALVLDGRMGTHGTRAARPAVRDAEQRGDRYTINTVSVRFGPVLRMAIDQYDRASKEFDDSCSLLPEGAFVLLRRLEVCSGIDLELYGRNPTAATIASPKRGRNWRRCVACGRTDESSCCSIVHASRWRLRRRRKSGAGGASACARPRRCRHARPEAPWAEALASLVRATVQHATGGDTSVTIAALEASATDTGSVPHAPLRSRRRFPPRDIDGQ